MKMTNNVTLERLVGENLRLRRRAEARSEDAETIKALKRKIRSLTKESERLVSENAVLENQAAKIRNLLSGFL